MVGDFNPFDRLLIERSLYPAKAARAVVQQRDLAECRGWNLQSEVPRLFSELDDGSDAWDMPGRDAIEERLGALRPRALVFDDDLICSFLKV